MLLNVPMMPSLKILASSVEIDTYNYGLAISRQVRAIFEKYGRGSIWGVIHIVVSSLNLSSLANVWTWGKCYLGIQSYGWICWNTFGILCQQCFHYHFAPSIHAQLWLHSCSLLFIGHGLQNTSWHTQSRDHLLERAQCLVFQCI